MIIDCISDLHGYYPKLEGGDLLIVAGDLTARDTKDEYFGFLSWLHEQKYSKKIVVAGNHDNLLEKIPTLFKITGYAEYLCDCGTVFEGLKLWGSPWTTRFEGMNPHCMAFTVDTDEELAEKWKLIPDDIDILITHSPPLGILDETERGDHVGSLSLRLKTENMNLKYHIFGHIHESGRSEFGKWINASYVNEVYEPVNKPIRIEI